jgi:hypothetical protein
MKDSSMDDEDDSDDALSNIGNDDEDDYSDNDEGAHVYPSALIQCINCLSTGTCFKINCSNTNCMNQYTCIS